MRLKDLTGSSNGVSNDNDVMYIVICHSRDKTYVDSHKLGFNGCDIYGLVLELFSDVVVKPDIGYGMYNMRFFNPAIHNSSSTV